MMCGFATFYGKHRIIATNGSNIILSEANNIIFAQAKTSFLYRPKQIIQHNTLHLAGKEVRKKDENFSSFLI